MKDLPKSYVLLSTDFNPLFVPSSPWEDFTNHKRLVGML